MLAKQDQFSLVQNLSNYQLGPAVNAGTLGLATQVAKNLMVETAAVVFKDSKHQELLTDAFSVISGNLVKHKQPRQIIQKFYNPESGIIVDSTADQLKADAVEIAKSLMVNADNLANLGLTGQQIGKAALRLQFQEIIEVFSDPVFQSKGKFDAKKATILLSASEVRELYCRLKLFYSNPEFKLVEFSSAILLVRKEEKAEDRMQVMLEQLKSGMPAGAATEYVLRSPEQRSWFNSIKDQPGFQDSHSALIRLAALSQEQRVQSLKTIIELRQQGSSVGDAIRVLVKAQKNPVIVKLFIAALGEDLVSTAAKEFAFSETAQKSPTFSLERVRSLRTFAVDLGWSDSSCVRYAVGNSRASRSRTTNIYSKADLVEGLAANLKYNLLIDAEQTDTVRYQTRLMLSKLSFDGIVSLYRLFFKEADVRILNDKLLVVSGYDGLAYNAAINGDQKWFVNSEPTYKKIKNGEFSKLFMKLAPFLLSSNDKVKDSIKQHLTKWLAFAVKHSHPAYVKHNPELAGLLIKAAIDNFDPYQNNPKPDIFAALQFQMAHFRKALIKFNLAEDKQALRAYKLFSESKTVANKAGQSDSEEIWSKLRSERPELSVAIEAAYKEWKRVSQIDFKSTAQ